MTPPPGAPGFLDDALGSDLDDVGEARMAGHFLGQGLVEADDLEAARADARADGVTLCSVLLARGLVERRDVFAARAELWGMDFIDLGADDVCQLSATKAGINVLLDHRWVPLRRMDGAERVVAVCEPPSGAVLDEILSALGAERVSFVLATDRAIDESLLAGFDKHLAARAALDLADSRPDLSAEEPAALWQKVAGIAVPLGLVVGFAANWQVTLSALLCVLNVMFALAVGMKVAIAVVGARARRRSSAPSVSSAPTARVLEGAELPTVTVLVPAYREANVVTDVVDCIASLDYPTAKLQVLVLLEEGDDETIEAANAAEMPSFVHLVVVPSVGPRTKPKACNVGLALATGELLVIYDAEDRPEPDQLRLAAAAFAGAASSTVCFQARLNYYNTYQNFLTRMFTIEYSTWFDFVLPGLEAMRLPIPLGGTSNHFRTSALRAVGGWDPYNVTEDADLGLRASALGLEVGVIDSTTWEEACSETRAWIRQRTRWIKGYIITAMVQLRRPSTALARLGWRGMVGLFGIVLGTPVLFLSAPLVWAFWLYTFLGGVVPDFVVPTWLSWVSLVTLVGGNVAMIAVGALAARRRGQNRLAGFALLNPVYWVLHSVAAWRALFQVATSPSVWEKTPHGISHGPPT